MHGFRKLIFGGVALGYAFTVPAFAAEELVKELGSPEALQFEGAKTFPTQALRKGLRWDLDFLLAAHPAAPLKDYLEVIERRLTRGYNHNGFPDARATARVDSGARQIILKVSEGRRYTCGDIRVTGARQVPANFVTNWLHEARLREPTNDFGFKWSNSLPVSFAGYPQAALASIVSNAFMDLGFARPKFDLQLTPDPRRGVADFVIQIQDEGPKMLIGEIDVLGAKTNSADSIIKFLGAKAGTEVRGDLIPRLNARLRESGRFVKHIVRVVPGNDPSRALLEMEVEELEGAPLLDQPLTPLQMTFLKARDWIVANAILREDFTIGFPLEMPHGLFHSNYVEMVLGAAGATVKVSILSNNVPAQLLYALRLGTNSFEFVSGKRGRKVLVTPAPLQIIATLEIEPKPEPDPEGRFQVNISAGFSNVKPEEGAEPLEARISLAPAGFLDLARLAQQKTSLQKGVLSVTNAGWRLSLDTTSGRPLQIEEEDGLMARFAAGRFQAAGRQLDSLTATWPNDWEPTNSVVSVSAFIVREILGAQWLTSEGSNTVQFFKAVDTAYRLPWMEIVSPVRGLFATNDVPPEQDFSVPIELNARTNPGMLAALALFLIPISDQAFDNGSWPWTFGRELAFILANKARYTEKEMERIQDSQYTGPLGCLAGARIFKQIQPGMARTFAIAGITRQSSRFFRQDCAVFLDGGAISGQIVRQLLSAVAKMDDKDAETIATALDPSTRELLRSVRRLYRARKDEPVSELLAPALDAYWDSFLKEKVRQQLREFLRGEG
jgi:hypothetical protein